jgi:hypothetical protein
MSKKTALLDQERAKCTVQPKGTSYSAGGLFCTLYYHVLYIHLGKEVESKSKSNSTLYWYFSLRSHRAQLRDRGNSSPTTILFQKPRSSRQIWTRTKKRSRGWSYTQHIDLRNWVEMVSCDIVHHTHTHLVPQ